MTTFLRMLVLLAYILLLVQSDNEILLKGCDGK